MTMMSSNFMSLSRCYLFDGIKIPKDYRYFEEDKAEHITGDLKRIQRQVEYEASNFKETYVQEIESLELSNIWARFFGDENFQLKGINISIKGGEKIAIIGSLDSGPSALVWVLTKIIDPEFGDYRFNGDLVTGVDTKVLRR
jgi:ABC-type siderophore export system fused ATPase/permease subunit